jgi:hypothetical protein
LRSDAIFSAINPALQARAFPAAVLGFFWSREGRKDGFMSKNRIVIAGVSYAAEMLPISGLEPGYVMMCLLESVGKSGQFTSDEATTFFSAGTCMVARKIGEFYVRSSPCVRA